MSKGLQNSNGLAEVLVKHEAIILDEWVKQMSGATRRADLIKDADLRVQCSRFIKLLRQGVESGSSDMQSQAWQPIREQTRCSSRTQKLCVQGQKILCSVY